MDRGVGLMGRPKARTPEPEDEEPKDDDTVAIIHLKGSGKYFKWLRRLHKVTLIPKASLFRQAMKEYCEKHGYEMPPDF